jgi:hypothetical protein
MLYDLWKRVSDWVSGATADKPKVTVDSSALPTGASTEAKQDIVNGAIKTVGSAAGTKAALVAGSDGTNAQTIKTNASGEQLVVLTGSKVPEGIADFRLNQEGTLLASAARTAGSVSPIQTNYNARGVVVFINVTAASGTGGLKPYVTGIDPISGSPVSLHTWPTAITATGLYIIVLYPASTMVATTSVKAVISLVLPRRWGVNVNADDASSYTYSLSYALIL